VADPERRLRVPSGSRLRSKKAAAMIVSALIAVTIVVVASFRDGEKSYDLNTPLGVAKRLVDISLILKRAENPDPVPALVCSPNQNGDLFQLKWQLDDTDVMYSLSHSITINQWTVEENFPNARVAVRISAHYKEDPKRDTANTWVLNLVRTDRWRLCSSARTS
jgi:hypothetical protein